MIGVYRIYNRVAGLVYIGSSAKDVGHRLRQHRHDLNKGKHPNPRLLKAWREYGADAFVFEVLEILDTAATKESILAREQFHIDRTRCCDPHIGYNIAPRAGSRLGAPHSAETKAYIKARLNDPEVRARISKGRAENPPVLTPQGRQRIVEANLGNQRGLGYRHSAEARSLISQKNIGKRSSGQFCNKGHPLSEDNLVVITHRGREERVCKICRNARGNKWLDSGNRDDWNRHRRERRGSKVGKYATHCKHGHALSGKNLRMDPKNGQRVCRACVNRRSQAYHAKAKSNPLPLPAAHD